MYVECHLLQNFAPSNLNRDDAGSPKDVMFGGYRRGRISSQCLKRAIRLAFRLDATIAPELIGTRTKRLAAEIAGHLVQLGKPEDRVAAVVAVALSSAGLKVVDGGKTQYLLYLGKPEIDHLTQLCEKHWDTLVALVIANATAVGASHEGERGKTKKPKTERTLAPEIAREFQGFLNGGGRAIDIAMFGRMLADLPQKNVEAACQVAHAVSTNKMDVDFDFYTAVDDLRPDDTAGADMIGTVELDSPCFYRYSNVNVDELTRNLGGDADAGRIALEAYLRAVIAAVPNGKQNGTAAQNPPSLILFVVRKHGLWSLANSFVKPITPEKGGDLVGLSVQALDRYWGDLAAMYGTKALVGTYLCVLGNPALSHLNEARVPNVEKLVTLTVNSAFPMA